MTQAWTALFILTCKCIHLVNCREPPNKCDWDFFESLPSDIHCVKESMVNSLRRAFGSCFAVNHTRAGTPSRCSRNPSKCVELASSQQGAPYLTREPILFLGCFCCLEKLIWWAQVKLFSDTFPRQSYFSLQEPYRVSLSFHMTALDIFEGSYVGVSSYTPTTVITPDIYRILIVFQTLF